jgi:hypothetical protein
MVVFGIFLPPVAMLGIPIRSYFLFRDGDTQTKILMAIPFIIWAYFTLLISQYGYISSRGGGTGPTVFPPYWIPVCLLWACAEIAYKNHKNLKSKETPGVE